MTTTLQTTAHRLAWWRVLTLAVAAFVFNTTEFIPIALLSDIGAGFSMSAAETGVMMTVYAWIVALASLPGMLLVARRERRGLLLALFALFIVSHVATAIAWNFSMLLAARAGVALAHAVFWAITAALAMRLAPPGKGQQAIGWLSMGSAMATVLGLPLGRLVGQALGWRATFALIALIAAMVMFAVYALLPRLPSRNAGSLRSLPQLARRPRLLGLYAFTAIIIAAHFTAYSYIEPFVRHFSALSEGATTALLLVFGLSGMVASVLFARLHSRLPTAFLVAAIALLLAAAVTPARRSSCDAVRTRVLLGHWHLRHQPLPDGACAAFRTGCDRRRHRHFFWHLQHRHRWRRAYRTICDATRQPVVDWL